MKKTSNKNILEKYWQQKDHQPMVIHEEMLRQITNYHPPAGGSITNKKILEVGAGMGGDSVFLAKKGADVTVLDFSREALEQVKENAEKEGILFNYVEADALDMPFKNDSFDIIFHQGFLEHFNNPEDYLKEQHRVLKKGGYLIVDVPQKYTAYTIKKHFAIRQNKWFAGWETEYSPRELRSIMEKCGFSVVNMYGWGYYGKIKILEKIIDRLPCKLWLNWCVGCVARKL